MQSLEVLSPVSGDLQPEETKKPIEQIHKDPIQPLGWLFLSKIRLPGNQTVITARTHSKWLRIARIAKLNA